MKKLPSTENDVKALVIQWFKDLGGFSFAPPASRGLGQHGIADRLGVIPVMVTPEMVGKKIGLFVAIEAKKPGRRGEKLAGATQAQVDFLKQVFASGGTGGLADCSLDLNAVEVWIDWLLHCDASDPCDCADSKLSERISRGGR